jgi:hypothetical protein
MKSFLMLLDEPAHIVKSVVGVIEWARRRFMAGFEHGLNWSLFSV